MIFAGKAHPKDREGKEVLKAVVSACQREELRRNLVFIEDYDLVVARYLVQGVDVWLNTPRRGMEASGTSGMKVVPNGGLNLSILDGWWCEGYRPEAGWAIGKGEDYQDHAYQDAVESSALYDLLESDVVPLFYGRAADGLPRAWIARMKRSMRLLTPAFSTNRMLWEYAERYYVPAAHCYERLAADGMAGARQIAAWKAAIRKGWGAVRIESVEDAGPGTPPGRRGLRARRRRPPRPHRAEGRGGRGLLRPAQRHPRDPAGSGRRPRPRALARGRPAPLRRLDPLPAQRHAGLHRPRAPRRTRRPASS